MPFDYPFGSYNVQSTVNRWFVTNITAFGTPSWMPSARVVFNWGVEQPLFSGYSGTVFSLNHLGTQDIQDYQGRTVDNGSAGVTKAGQVEINCWINKSIAGPQYYSRLVTMADMVSRLFTVYNVIPLLNVQASVANPPSATGRVAFVTPVDYQQPQADSVNPDVWRIRAIAPYQWTERT